MSQENLELALRAYDAFNRRDWDGFVALMDDDVEIVTRIAAIEGGRHGHEGMRRWWENMLTAFPDYDIEVVDVRDLGGRDVGVPARSRRGPTRSRLSKRLRRTARARPAYDCAVDVAAFIERYDRAWNEQDVDAIMAMHTPDMVFENHTRGVRAEGPAVRELLESTFADQPHLRFRGRRRYVGDDFVVSEWTASATDAHGRRIEWDGIDVFPFRDGLIARKDVYSASHAPRVL